MFSAAREIDEVIAGIDFEKIAKHPNILIAARFWSDDRYQAAKTCYRFMRKIDDMIDDRKALNEVIGCIERKQFRDQVNHWVDCLEHLPEEEGEWKEIAYTIDRFRIPLEFFRNFASSMVFDIDHDDFESFEQFLEYAEGASNGPASVFVHLCCLRKENGHYISPAFNVGDVARSCAIFSYLVHIIRDFQKDQLDHLNYFPLDMLKKHGLEPEKLEYIARGGEIPEGFRNLIREYLEIAEIYREQTENVLKSLEQMVEPSGMLSLQVIYDLYLQIFERIDPDYGNFTTEELNPPPAEIRERVVRKVAEFLPVVQLV